MFKNISFQMQTLVIDHAESAHTKPINTRYIT